jgi:hypothetical protein
MRILAMESPRNRIVIGLLLWLALLASGPISAEEQVLSYKPPYVDCSHWKKDTRGIDKARASCNRQSGSLGVLAQAWVGAAAADAMQTIHFTVNQDSKVTVEADITYAGGASTNGFGSFAGVYAVWRVDRRDQERQAIDPGLGFDDVRGKIIDLALLAGGATAEAEAIDQIGLIVSVQQLHDQLANLKASGKAKTYRLRKTFTVKKGAHALSVGLRGNTSAALTGSAFVILAGQLDGVKLTINPK